MKLKTTESEPDDAEMKLVSLCVGCRQPILDQFILRVAPDLEWHAGCLRCADCAVQLNESCTCFVREGRIYCKSDYMRLYGTKCAKCEQGFNRNDLVMRAKDRVFHQDCFRCSACTRQLMAGDEFALKENRLLCKHDHDLAVVESPPKQCSPTQPDTTPSLPALSPATVEDGDVKFDENDVGSESGKSTGDESVVESGGGGQRSVPNGGQKGSSHKETKDKKDSADNEGKKSHKKGTSSKDQKTTRIRTVLNEKQLHTLRTCYAANPRPDALMKEQLVEMTSLSPRVIRVWFQNKRCKDKKRQMMLKQVQHHVEKNGNRLAGAPLQAVSLVAGDPVRHEPPPMHPIEAFHQAPPPWKTLSDFALHAEMEAAPFQQLINSFDQESSPTPPPPQSLPHHPHFMNGDDGGGLTPQTILTQAPDFTELAMNAAASVPISIMTSQF